LIVAAEEHVPRRPRRPPHALERLVEGRPRRVVLGRSTRFSTIAGRFESSSSIVS
jgi:hypothetical protein